MDGLTDVQRFQRRPMAPSSLRSLPVPEDFDETYPFTIRVTQLRPLKEFVKDGEVSTKHLTEWRIAIVRSVCYMNMMCFEGLCIGDMEVGELWGAADLYFKDQWLALRLLAIFPSKNRGALEGGSLLPFPNLFELTHVPYECRLAIPLPCKSFETAYYDIIRATMGPKGSLFGLSVAENATGSYYAYPQFYDYRQAMLFQQTVPSTWTDPTLLRIGGNANATHIPAIRGLLQDREHIFSYDPFFCGKGEGNWYLRVESPSAAKRLVEKGLEVPKGTFPFFNDVKYGTVTAAVMTNSIWVERSSDIPKNITKSINFRFYPNGSPRHPFAIPTIPGDGEEITGVDNPAKKTAVGSGPASIQSQAGPSTSRLHAADASTNRDQQKKAAPKNSIPSMSAGGKGNPIMIDEPMEEVPTNNAMIDPVSDPQEPEVVWVADADIPLTQPTGSDDMMLDDSVIAMDPHAQPQDTRNGSGGAQSVVDDMKRRIAEHRISAEAAKKLHEQEQAAQALQHLKALDSNGENDQSDQAMARIGGQPVSHPDENQVEVVSPPHLDRQSGPSRQHQPAGSSGLDTAAQARADASSPYARPVQVQPQAASPEASPEERKVSVLQASADRLRSRWAGERDYQHADDLAEPWVAPQRYAVDPNRPCPFVYAFPAPVPRAPPAAANSMVGRQTSTQTGPIHGMREGVDGDADMARQGRHRQGIASGSTAYRTGDLGGVDIVEVDALESDVDMDSDMSDAEEQSDRPDCDDDTGGYDGESIPEEARPMVAVHERRRSVSAGTMRSSNEIEQENPDNELGRVGSAAYQEHVHTPLALRSSSVELDMETEDLGRLPGAEELDEESSVGVGAREGEGNNREQTHMQLEEVGPVEAMHQIEPDTIDESDVVGIPAILDRDDDILAEEETNKRKEQSQIQDIAREGQAGDVQSVSLANPEFLEGEDEAKVLVKLEYEKQKADRPHDAKSDQGRASSRSHDSAYREPAGASENKPKAEPETILVSKTEEAIAVVKPETAKQEDAKPDYVEGTWVRIKRLQKEKDDAEERKRMERELRRQKKKGVDVSAEADMSMDVDEAT